jgi:hypothetical protein
MYVFEASVTIGSTVSIKELLPSRESALKALPNVVRHTRDGNNSRKVSCMAINFADFHEQDCDRVRSLYIGDLDVVARVE